MFLFFILQMLDIFIEHSNECDFVTIVGVSHITICKCNQSASHVISINTSNAVELKIQTSVVQTWSIWIQQCCHKHQFHSISKRCSCIEIKSALHLNVLTWFDIAWLFHQIMFTQSSLKEYTFESNVDSTD